MGKITMDRVAAMSVQYWHYSFAYFLDSMEACGIRNIELWAGEPHYYRPDYGSFAEAAAAIRTRRRQMEDRGMRVIMYTPETLSYPFNPAASHEAWWRRTIDMYREAMEDALAFGTNQLFVNSGWGLRDEPRQAAWDRAVDTFAKVCAYAREMGVDVNMEQLQPYESNLVCTSADLGRMLDDVGADNLHCCLDIGAMAVAGEAIDDFYRLMPGKVRHVHFSDLNHEVPGDRGLPLAEYIRSFEARGYEGYLSLEVNDTMYIEKPHEAFLRAAERMRGFLA